MQFEVQVPNNYTSGTFMSLMEIWRVVGQALGSQYLSFFIGKISPKQEIQDQNCGYEMILEVFNL